MIKLPRRSVRYMTRRQILNTLVAMHEEAVLDEYYSDAKLDLMYHRGNVDAIRAIICMFDKKAVPEDAIIERGYERTNAYEFVSYVDDDEVTVISDPEKLALSWQD